MIAALRRLVYWLGFRPKAGTILYSPSREARLVLEELYESFVEGFKVGMRQVRDAVKS